MSTKSNLLDYAETLARERGFDAFSYADLSKEIGISKASIHHHFPAKADLARELIQRYRRIFFEDLLYASGRKSTAAEQLQVYIDAYKSALRGGRQVCLCVAFSTGRDSFDDAVISELKRFHSDSIDWLAEVFENAGSDKSIADVTESGKEARACLALMEGAQLVARAARNTRLFDASTEMLRARLS